jgi:hypothetical protein
LGDQRNRLEPQEEDAARIGLVIVELASPCDRLLKSDAGGIERKLFAAPGGA